MKLDHLLTILKINDFDKKNNLFKSSNKSDKEDSAMDQTKSPGKREEEREKLLSLIRKLREKDSLVQEGLIQLLNLHDEVTGLMGSCEDCFGKDPFCNTCKGKGTNSSIDFDKGKKE